MILALLWGTYRRTSVIVTIALMALLVFCATFAGLYFSTRVQDAEKVTTIIGTAHDNYGPAYFGCCSTSFARKEIDDLTSELTVGTTDRFVRNGEPTSNSSRDVTLPSTFNSSVSTPMRTPDSKSAPSKLTAHQTTMFFYTTKRTSKVSARSVVAPTSSPEKESYTEIFKSEKIIIGGGKGSSPGRFNTPNGVAVSSDNEIYVADRETRRFVQVYNREGHRVVRFRIGTGKGNYPQGICTDSLGNIIVANLDKNRVDMFTSRGEFVRTVARTKPPNGIAIGPDGQLVVTHLERDIITIFPRQTVSS
ncbi:TRIM71 [Branchiostoma lanceolatum]|uniref:TRIM71 protein n=1 Tax=Branchiostoma lanceolatum TaxID=7740 RepID=A0A8K0EQH9_BRALA|nr:TRIM71 [Branchiostoma lanceolatum]